MSLWFKFIVLVRLITSVDHDVNWSDHVLLYLILGPPNLRDDAMYRIVENNLNVPVDLSQAPAAFPQPRNFTWTRNTVMLNNPTLSLTYSSIIFPSVRRSDAGRYVVSATNFVIDNDMVQIGSDIGSFTLDVICKTMFADLVVLENILSCLVTIDGPTFAQPSPLQRYAPLGNPLSLVCGTGLDSNPQATITWTAPDTTAITMDFGRYTVDNGPGIVRLNFTHTSLSDTGIWRCEARVVSAQDIVSDRSLVPQNPSVIGTPIVHDIQLTIIGECSY